MQPTFAPTIVHDQLVESATAKCIAQLTLDVPERIERVIWQPGSVGNFDSSRNWAVRHFLGGEAEIMLMIDSDMVFTTQQALDLVDQCTHDTPVVSGLYFVGSTPPRPCVAMSTPPSSMIALETYEPGEILEADGFGHGFVAIHRDVLWEVEGEYEDREQPWYTQSAITWGGRVWEADYGFNWRVRQLGYPCLVDTNIAVGHIKPRVLDDKEFWKRKGEIFEIPVD
jgi:hypothetical protein